MHRRLNRIIFHHFIWTLIFISTIRHPHRPRPQMLKWIVFGRCQWLPLIGFYHLDCTSIFFYDVYSAFDYIMNIRETISQIQQRLQRLSKQPAERMHIASQNEQLQLLRQENRRLIEQNNRISCQKYQSEQQLRHYEEQMQREISHKLELLERMKTLECLLENRSMQSKFSQKVIKLMKKKKHLHYDPCLKECWQWLKQLTNHNDSP